ncbi:YisL family protein [Metabacillus idriensis]|uniref:YisL family protein n=1 Tax=Metabacillus idriensis TaxID=324768 RepID=UPI0008AA5A42|nr:YisL family protein [Metabacillus idriensis]MCM3595306.1 YisL family protein [Metabacillus idriensis]OHR72349.1 hypothetical protein HMPREF3291_22065 [Bacillus sp. HMSC76G11]
MTTHLHITTWVVALILFFVANSLFKSGKEKPFKIVHMTLRLFYLLIIGSGLQLLLSLASISGEYIGKAILGVYVIAMMEIILVRAKKKKPTRIFWIQFVIVLIVVILLGLRLPIGLKFF